VVKLPNIPKPNVCSVWIHSVLPTGALAYQGGDQVSIYIVWVKGCLKGFLFLQDCETERTNNLD